MNKTSLMTIDAKARAIKTRLKNMVNSDSLTFGQQMEIEECIRLAQDVITVSTKELDNVVINL